MTAPLLKINKLSVEFANSIIAAKEVSFEINPGSFVSLIGRSGSGKSVTAMSVCSLLKDNPKISGQIFWQWSKGEVLDLLKVDKKQLSQIRGKEISYVFQDPASAWNPVFCIGEQMSDALKAHVHLKESEVLQVVKNALASVGFEDVMRVMKSYPHQLSGGMKQRALIAQAIALKSRLIIADEPTSALDSEASRQILKLLQSLAKTYTAVLLITHDIVLASKYCSQIIVMEKGGVVEELRMVEGKFEPQHPWSRSLFELNLENYKPKEMIHVHNAD